MHVGRSEAPGKSKRRKRIKRRKKVFRPIKSFYEHFRYLTNRIILNNKRQEVCDKKKWEEENLPALLLVSLTFLILSHLTVGLLVSRVRAYLSTNQQQGLPRAPDSTR